ncbi:carboxymuconolactone decarboxylase family protein [Luteolibacter marinus]|uniref:carboxymuconolactone decarboxylase family protein n=1 Tax=Luteolibacter marinus TaxID=2776705 RepID=UPI001866AF38|nr:carboxymuconolactone decarboxylase family protein [Luteolibacter marinus]
MNLKLQTIESAPEASRPLLEGARKSLGFVPNLFAVFANSPAVLEAYQGLGAAYGKSSLSPAEQEIVTIAVSIENGCDYCVAAHTTIGQMRKVDAAVLGSLRDGAALEDPRHEALRRFALEVVRHRGWVPGEEQQAFLDAGFTPAQALEVVLGVTLKTLSNFTNHLATTPLDAAFSKNAWSAGVAA